MRRPFRWMLLALAIAAGALPARADDGAVSGVGGSIHLMQGHPSVRMVSERVLIRLNGDPDGAHRVAATFVFRNEGPATTVTMGFPEGMSGEGGPFSSFSARVDGEAARVQTTPWQGVGDDRRRWRTKRVAFAQGQTRIVADSYTTRGSEDTGGNEGISYILTTGSSWKGPIGQATVEIDASAVQSYGPMRIWPAGCRRQGGRIIWRWRNLEPTKNIGVTYNPYYWWRRLLPDSNDHPVDCLRIGNAIGLRAGPRLDGNTLLVPAGLLPVLIKGSRLRWDSRRAELELTAGSNRVVIPVPGSAMVVNGRSVALPARARKIAGRASVPLRAVAQAVGWRIRLEAGKSADELAMPPAIRLEPAK